MTTTRLTDTQLQAIKEGCEGVTPGPWEYGSVRLNSRNVAHLTRCDPQTITALVTELIERRAGDSAIVEACAKVAEDRRAYCAAKAMRKGISEHDENVWGSAAGEASRIAAAIRALAPPAPAVVEKAMAQSQDGGLAAKIAQIANDFIPDSDKDAPLALQEIREALRAALAEARALTPPAPAVTHADAALHAALRASPCPRPANDCPDDQTAGECCDIGFCGCGNAAALEVSAPALTLTREQIEAALKSLIGVFPHTPSIITASGRSASSRHSAG